MKNKKDNYLTNQFNNFQTDVKFHMVGCINKFKENINKIHLGRVSPNMLSNIQVECYGRLVPISQLTNSVVENSRTLSIDVFDLKVIKLVEKAILSSSLNLTPISHGNRIRITLPPLTEERRFSLIKLVRSESEKSKISIRNIRRIANEKIKFFLKNKEISLDEDRYFQNEIQKLTDFWIKEVDFILKKKESELMMF